MENKLINLKTKIEDHLKKNGRRPQKKNHFMIPLEFKGKPFLGMAHLSKIIFSSFKNVIQCPRFRPGPSQAEH